MTLTLFLALAFGSAKVSDLGQANERTVFQTGSTYTDRINLRADVAIVYGIDKTMPARIKAWRDKGYRIHLMTGVAWGEYQDYYFGRWDGINHEDEAQTRANGEKIGHGGDVYYMSPGANYGKYLAEGIKRALDAGVEAVHLEEPEFWNFGGYGAGFKREWHDFYKEEWRDPSSSPDARWRAAKLMYFLYRRALQQVFDSIQEYNKAHGTHVRCYVPTHSLLNYASWNIVSPESSLARLNGCDGYIAQVWTGTARTPNVYQGEKKERTFETAFLEYGAMQNLVRSTGRSVWNHADPIEDNPDHDWGDYRQNYHSTLIASLLQPEVSQYEVMPWPERIFNGKYPSETDRKTRVPIPQAYATELQVVINALKDMKQNRTKWVSGSGGVGFVVSDSLMFQRGGPSESDAQMGHVYGLALPFVKRGIPIQPIQFENVTLPGYLKDTKLLLMTYEGMKPLSAEVDVAIASWVKSGGTLVFVDNDSDPFNRVREWWNTSPMNYKTPREHLFEQLGLDRSGAKSNLSPSAKPTPLPSVGGVGESEPRGRTGGEGESETERVQLIGRGRLIYLKRSPTDISRDSKGADWLIAQIKTNSKSFPWRDSSSLILNRGPYVVAAGMDESSSVTTTLKGPFIDLFDPELKVQNTVTLSPDSRHFLIDLTRFRGEVVAASGQVKTTTSDSHSWSGTLEGVADTQAVLLLKIGHEPTTVTVGGRVTSDTSYDSANHLLRIRFANQPRPQRVEVRF